MSVDFGHGLWLCSFFDVFSNTVIELKTFETDVFMWILKETTIVKIVEYAESYLHFYCSQLQSYLHAMRKSCWICSRNKFKAAV